MTSSRRIWFKLAGVALAATLVSAPVTTARAAAPNVLFIVADDLRAELGCYGSKDVLSPNIDALARRGVVFSRAYCQQAVCNPSRTSALTGLRPDQVRVWDLAARFRVTRPDAVTLPQYFKEHGYTSLGIGKIFHNESLRPEAPPRFPMADPMSWSEPPVHATGAHWQDWVVPGDPSGPKKKGDVTQSLDVPDNAYFDGQIADEACAALRRLREGNQPFFLAVGFWKPHLPFNAPKKYWDLYQRAALTAPVTDRMPAGAPAIAGHDFSELRGYGRVPKTGPVPREEIGELRHGYYACISFLDAQVGRVLAELRRQGLEDNTVVVLWGDHGFHLGEHALWGKTSNYELDARIPLIVSAPGLPRGGRADGIVEMVDVYPTLVELGGLPERSGLAGKSFVPLLRDPRAPGKPYAITQHPHPFYGGKSTHMGYAVRTQQFRYVEWRVIATGQVTDRELYDYNADPAETVNRVEDPAYRDAVTELSRRAAEEVAAGQRWPTVGTK